MDKGRLSIKCTFAVVLILLGLASPLGGAGTALAAPEQQDPLILSYAAKFVCQEALQPGQYWYGLGAPVVQQKTEVLIHNPNAFPITLYKKAVLAPVENFSTVDQGKAPGKWREVKLAPDFAFRIDCDDITKLLTGDPAATLIGTVGIGNPAEGFVVIGIGPQTATGAVIRFPQLDVTAEYARSSELMKKDIHYQPWWRWWWWGLPWQLGYPYHRLIRLQAGTANVGDPRRLLYDALQQEAPQGLSGAQLDVTVKALNEGYTMPPEPQVMPQTDLQTPNLPNNTSKPALVALLGNTEYLSAVDGPMLSVDFVLVSNQSPADPDPTTNTPTFNTLVTYPWIPGHWYDLPVVMPQNQSSDIHQYFINWHTQQWIGVKGAPDAVRSAMAYWFPYWCGWGYWWSGWHGSDCIDIAVGEGESLDVNQITPVRVFYPQWPPQ